MTKPIPQIKKFMTTTPLSIEGDSLLKVAYDLMKKNNIRHLPVMAEGKVSGVITSTDIALVRGLSGVDLEKMRVKECFTPLAYTVHPDTGLDEVIAEMAEKKIGCAIVTDHDHLVGIFTWIDALKATYELLGTRLRK